MIEVTNDETFAMPDEILVFCNRVRKAGGADPLDALLPARPQEQKSCLIALALNHECQVFPVHRDDCRYADGSQKWYMLVDPSLVKQIAEGVGCPVEKVWIDQDDEHETSKEVDAILLPRRIGRAAQAFDDGEPVFEEWVDHDWRAECDDDDDD